MDSDKQLEYLYHSLFNHDKTIVGWGTGSVYEYFSSLIPIKLDHIIDNNPDRHGQPLGKLTIESPQILKSLDPDNTIILVFSSFIEQITEQVRTLGNFHTLPASFVAGYEDLCFQKHKLRSIIHSRPLTPQKKDPTNAILIQGPLTNYFTVENVRFYAHAYQNTPIILSTWEASNPLYLQELEPLVDHLILSTPPTHAGYQNRNYQLTSSLAGIQKAQEIGAQYTLKTRTDLALLAPDFLTTAAHMLSSFDASKAQSLGLQNRILIPETYTRKYILYHPADLFLFGHTQDLLKFFSTPHDERDLNLNTGPALNQTLLEISRSMGPAEAYLGRNFAQTLGWNIKDTLEDSLNFIRDCFLVTDNSLPALFWYKYPRITSLKFSNPAHRCINHYTWLQLYHNTFDLETALHQVDIESTPWSHFNQPTTIPKIAV